MYRKERLRSNKKKIDQESSELATVSGLPHASRSKDAHRSKRSLFIVVGIFVVVLLGIFAIPYYKIYVAPFNRTVITVDTVHISMRYFLERTRLAKSDPMSMLQSLTEERVIKLVAPQYGIQVTDADIDKELRNMAGGGTDEISDVEFKEWYRQQLNNNKVSNSLYREMVHTNLLTTRLRAYLAERVPTVAEQVHLHAIAVQTLEEAQEVEDRLKSGEDFASVAREVSIDTDLKDKGGDLGWLPAAVSIFEEQISALAVNQVSAPIPYYNPTRVPTGATMPAAYYILMISEKDNARQLDDEHREVLKDRALELWLPGEIQKHTIKYNFNSEIYAWMNWQLQKK